MMRLGMILVLGGLAVLAGCATPEFSRDSGAFELRLLPLDQRFPNLALYSPCIQGCDRPPRSYSIVHLDDGLPDGDVEMVSSYSRSRHFEAPPVKAFPASYSRRPRFRVLDNFDHTEQSGRYEQVQAFYHETPGAVGHARVVFIGQTDCRDAETRRRTGTDRPRFRLEVAAVVVVEARAFFFLEPPAGAPACADLTPGEVLGDVQGLPADLLKRRFVVRVADLDLAKDEFQFRSPSVYAVRVTGNREAFGYSGMECRDSLKDVAAVLPECIRPPTPLVLVADPRPSVDMDSLPVTYDCTWRSSSVDWNVFLGMAAKMAGTGSYSQKCRKRR